MEELTIHFPLYKAMMGLSYTKFPKEKGEKKEERNIQLK
jgi:hypothetical protein